VHVSCASGIVRRRAIATMENDVETRRYSAGIAGGVMVAQNVTYDELLTRLLDFVLNAPVARAVDDFAWEQEEVLRGGLRSIDFFSGGKSLWWDRDAFDTEKEGMMRNGTGERFLEKNELDARFLRKLDADLREHLKRAGYITPSLITSMKPLYRDISADLSDRSAQARTALVTEILRS
jgi:hypothetical protein